MYLQQLGSALMNLVARHDFRSQVPWEEYLQALDQTDRCNVVGLCQKLERLSKERNLPLAVVAVGSVLNSAGKDTGIAYRDIDLLLVPVLRSDLRRFYAVVATFLAAQPETKKKSFGLSRTHLRGKLLRALETDAEKFLRMTYWYRVSIYWQLEFPRGKPMEIFVRQFAHCLTMADMAAHENAQKNPSTISRLVFS